MTKVCSTTLHKITQAILVITLLMGSGCAELHYRAPSNSSGGPVFVYNGRYLSDLPEVNELKASGYLYAGNYRKVEQLLAGRPLSEWGLFWLDRARLALGKRPIGLVARQNPMLEGLQGFYLANLGYLQGAEAVFRRNIPQVKADREILELGLAAVLNKQSRTEDARQALEAVKSRVPDLPALKVFEGDLALNHADYSTAWQFYSEAKAAGYLRDDPVFETKLGIAALGAGRDITGLAAEIQALDAESGLVDYLEAHTALHSGDFSRARNSLTLALTKQLPPQVKSNAETLALELESRLNAEPAIQAAIANPN